MLEIDLASSADKELVR